MFYIRSTVCPEPPGCEAKTQMETFQWVTQVIDQNYKRPRSLKPHSHLTHVLFAPALRFANMQPGGAGVILKRTQDWARGCLLWTQPAMCFFLITPEKQGQMKLTSGSTGSCFTSPVSELPPSACLSVNEPLWAAGGGSPVSQRLWRKQ